METRSARGTSGRVLVLLKPFGTEMSYSKGECTAAASGPWLEDVHGETSVQMVKVTQNEPHCVYYSRSFLWKKIAVFERNRELRPSISPSVEKHKPSLGGLKSNSQAVI